MRKIYLFLVIMLVLGACSKDDIKTYKGDNYLQFVKVVTDSSVCSFLAYPNDNELEFPVEVEVIGLPSEGEQRGSREIKCHDCELQVTGEVHDEAR